ncbi:MAG TPA: c-type cytochrome [Candidatus Krumholzibacteria bacterium]|nr:c-type cytochrome [Candidatus Krumholzibacteria bacterium]
MKFAHRLAVICAALVLAATSASAQIPDKFTNLKVLPKDTPKPELVKIMRGFAGDLGVRCGHCHYAKNPEDFSSFNFASDQKPEKEVARNMMRMAMDINKTLDKDFKDTPDHLKVSCFTCHHGNEKPEKLADAIVPVLKKDGPEAAATRYRDLRKEYYGSAAYDFTEWSLVEIAEDLRHDPAQIKNARALLTLNLENFPESAQTYAQIAETYVAENDMTSAMTNFDKALQLAPDDPRLKARIEQVKAGGGQPPKK